MTLDNLDVNTRVWAQDKELVKKENIQAQMCKVIEEVGETAAAVLKGDRERIKDGIGDSIVTLTILAQQHGLSLRECWQAAYDEIKDRTGKTVNGSFIKDK